MSTLVEEVIDRQQWLEPVGTVMQRATEITLDRPGTVAVEVRNFLHGTWLGHPLHPVLTDIPLGAWTTAAVLDVSEMLTGREDLQAGTDAAIGFGLVGAAGAAVTGLNDWQHLTGTARRVGTLHALLNVGATSLNLASWLLRRAGRRRSGQALSLLGWGLAACSAYLGGSLVYKEKIGVDHAPAESLPDDFVAVLPESELADGQMRRVEVAATGILLVRRGDRIFALAETCAHLGGPLVEGNLEGQSVRCPWHGSRFSLETGEVLEGPAVFPQPCLDVRIRAGQIEVRARRTAHGA